MGVTLDEQPVSNEHDSVTQLSEQWLAVTGDTGGERDNGDVPATARLFCWRGVVGFDPVCKRLEDTCLIS